MVATYGQPTATLARGQRSLTTVALHAQRPRPAGRRGGAGGHASRSRRQLLAHRVPLKRGSSASAFINVEEHELHRFLDAFNLKSGEKRKNLPVTQLAVDVRWLSSDPAPLGVSFVSSVPRQGAQPGSASGTLQFEETVYSFDK